MPEMIDPNPPILANPPVRELAIPPDAVCWSKFFHWVPEFEADVVELDCEGLPKLILFVRVAAPIERDLESPDFGTTDVLELILSEAF